MKKRFFTTMLAVLLAVSLPVTSFAAGLGDYPDAPQADHWSHAAMDYAVQHDLLRGIDGNLAGDGNLTRAQMGTVVNRAFGATAKADISQFNDVAAGDWFAEDMAKAVQMGTLAGRAADQMAPNTPITREEVMAIMVRLLALPTGDTSALNSFADGATVSDWAAPSVAALVKCGIVAGSDNRLRPKATITRAEFAALLMKTFPNIVRSAADLADLKDGNVLLVGDVGALKDVHVKGALLFADGLGDVRISLDGVDIDGDLIIRGGHLKMRTTDIGGHIIANDPNRTTEIDADKADGVDAKTPVRLVNGLFKNVKGENVEVNEPDAKIIAEQDKDTDKKDKGNKKPSSGSGSYTGGPGGDDAVAPSQEEKVLEGDANVDQRQYPEVNPFVHPPFYNARVKVTLKGDGKTIKSVVDNNTATKGWDPSKDEATWNKKNAPFWDKLAKAKYFDKFAGKTRDEVANMTDIVSGATESSHAVKEAVLNALDGKAGKGFLTPEQTLTAGPLEIDGNANDVVTFKNTLPKDFDVQLHSVYHTVYNGDGTYLVKPEDYTWEKDGNDFKLTVKNKLKAGHYYVNITDANGKWRSPDFESGHGTPRHYPHFVVKSPATLAFENGKLTVSDGDFKNVSLNVEEIVIKDKNDATARPVEIEPVGHHGTVGAYKTTPFFKENDGSIDTTYKAGRKNEPVFVSGHEYEIEVNVWGYEPITFAFTAPVTNNREGHANVDQRQYPKVDPFVHPPFYNARVKVELNDNGTIKSVSDNNTATKGWDPSKNQKTWDKKNKPYWDVLLASGLFEKFVGKDLAGVQAMSMAHGGADAVTGATESGKAVQEAVINALENKAGKGFLKPEQTLTAEPIEVAKGTTGITFANTLPEDFDVQLHSVYHTIYNGKNESDKVSAASLAKGDSNYTLTVPGDLKAGHYYVNITDANGKYRSPDFESGHGTPRHYPHFVVKSDATLAFNEGKLTVSDNDIANVIANIEEIIVKEADHPDAEEIEIEPIGHHGIEGGYSAGPFFNNDGSVNPDAMTGKASNPKYVFEPGKTYDVTLHVWGYGDKPLSFQYSAPEADVLEGDANVDQRQYPAIKPFIHPPFYNARVKVTLRADGTTIRSVADNDTATKGWDPSKDQATWDKKNAPFWGAVVDANYFSKFVGKSRDEVAEMKDVVSGATESSHAVKEAVLNALDKKAGKTFLTPAQTLTAKTIEVEQGTTDITFTNTLPEDFNVQLHSVYHTIYNAKDGNEVNGTSLAGSGEEYTLTVPGDLKAGHYYVNITDANGKYRSPDFESGHGTPRHYPHFVVKSDASLGFNEGKLTVSDNDLANVIANIEEIVVKEADHPDAEEIEIEPIGHHGTEGGYSAGPFFNNDGSVNPDAKTGKASKPVAVFEPGKTYDVALHVWGYGEEPFTFQYTAPDKTGGEEDEPQPEPTGEAFALETAGVGSYGYQVKMKGTVKDGVITALEDNGTTAGASELVFKKFVEEGGFNKFINKTADEIKAMSMETGSADVVSGATVTSKAVHDAIINYLDK